MATIARIRVALSGLQGLPGVSTFYALDPVVAVPALSTFYNAMSAMWPDQLSIVVEAAGDVINEANGEAVGTWSTAAPTPVETMNSGSYSAPGGIAATWLTGTFIGGRRVRGRTFLVPIASQYLESNGTWTFQALQTVRDAGAVLIASTPENMLVYHRETAEGAADGGGVAMTGVLVNDKVAVLRSRRD